MRNRTRRSFAVEVKSAGRRQGTVIPSRITPPAAPAARVPEARPPDPPAAVVETRRILPSLIVAEAPPVEPEAVAAEGGHPPRRRGRPRKPAPAEIEAVVSVTAMPEAALTPAAPVPRARPTPAKRVAKPAILAPGERWKRRLGRWHR